MKPQAQEKTVTGEPKTRARRVELIVISSDDAFLIELGPILGDQYRTRPLDGPAGMATLGRDGQWIALVDATSLPDARAAVARMEQQHRNVPIIVAAASTAEWSNSVSRGSIVAAVAREQLDAAPLRDALTKAEAQLQKRASGAQSSTDDAKPAGGKLPLIAAAVAVLVLAGGYVAWRTFGTAPSAATAHNPAAAGKQAATAAPVTKPQTAFELLSAARVAFRDQKLLLPRADGEPRGDSALELYAQVLAQEPTNDEALDGVQRLLAVGKTRIQTDLASGKLDEATRLIAFFKAAGVDANTLHEFDAAIAAARPKWLAARVQDSINAGDYAAAEQLLTQLGTVGADRSVITELRRALDAKKADQQLTSLAGSVKAAIDQGALLDPANDNARTRLLAMRAVNRTHSLTLSAQHDVIAALLARAADATKRDEFELAQRYIGAAGELGSAADVADAKHALQAEVDAVAQRAAAAAAAAKAHDTANDKATTAAAAPVAPKAPAFIAARSVGGLRVDYPEAAAAARITGTVTVEFTLHPDGSASDATIIEATQPKTFDQAAKTAVLRARYDTTTLPDHQATRARIKIAFKPS